MNREGMAADNDSHSGVGKRKGRGRGASVNRGPWKGV